MARVAALIRLRLLAVLAMLLLGPGAALAGITFDPTVTGGASNATNMEVAQDFNNGGPTGMYVGLSFTSDTPLTNVYARAVVSGGAGTTAYKLNASEPADHFIGDLSTSPRTSYWFIDLPTAAGSTGNFYVEIYTGKPGTSGAVFVQRSRDYTISSLDGDQKASPNTVAFVRVVPSTLQLGQSFNVEVCYNLVSNAGGNILISPASLSSYNPVDSLLAVKMDLYDGANSSCNTNVVGTYVNQLYYKNVGKSGSSVLATYTFRARGATDLLLSPLGAAFSGKYKFNGDFANTYPITAPTNFVVISKSVNVTASAGATVVTYSLTATNNGLYEVVLDEFEDTLPSLPAVVSYEAGSSYFNNVQIADPLKSGQVLTWGNPGGSKAFVIPKGESRSLTFQASIPGTWGDYENQAIARIGTTVLDTTPDTITDNVPAKVTTKIGPQISGRVFEDVNYGGGAGRACGAVSGSPACSTSGAVGRQYAVVELYNQETGAFVASATTDANGDYGFSGLPKGTYVVRVVNSTVTSSRSGYMPGLLPVQTYRAQALTGDSTPVTDRVGGENPCSADAAANTASATLASLTSGATVNDGSACSAAPVTLPQSVAVVYVDPDQATVGLRKPTGTFDFGFNFDTIVNVKGSGQGSLDQFIRNSNALDNTGLQQFGQTAGREVSIFMIPDGLAHAGLREGLTSQLATGGGNAGAAVITLSGPLPQITGTNTSIDATTQTANVGDTNDDAAVGSGGSVGTDGLVLSTVPRPEVAINANGIDSAAVLEVSGAGAVLKGFALYNHRPSGETAALANTAAVSLAGATSFTQLLVGTLADGTVPESLRNAGVGIGVLGGASIVNNYIAHHGIHNLSFGSTASGSASGNELAYGGWNSASADSVRVLAKSVTLSGNLIRDLDTLNATLAVGNGKGIEIAGDADGVVVENNTIRAMRTAGIGIHGGSDGTRVSKNIVTGTLGDGSAGSGAGILVSEGSGLGTGAPQRTTLTRNSLYANAGLGIDLAASALPDGVTANDGATNASAPNNGIDYPVFTSAILGGGKLTVTGHVGSAAGQAAFANATLELFVADNTPPNQNGNVVAGDGQSVAHGEGRTYLFGSCSTDSAGAFSCELSVSGLTSASALTATATDSLGSTSEFGANFSVTVLGVDLSGTVYGDVNHNALLDAGESGTGQTLHVKLVARSGGTCGGPATAAAPVNASSGAYSLSGVTAGEWCLVLDDNDTASDVASNAPAGWLRTETPTGVRQLTVGSSNQSSLNFGLYHGSVLTGSVFGDTGVGGGVANDGVQNGAEAGLANVTVKATDDSGATTHATAYTSGAGAYELWIPASANGTIRIVETNLGGFVSTGGQAGSTGGSYTRASDSVSFTHIAGSSHSGVNFGDVPENAFVTDGVKGASPGSTLWFSHTFTAGTAGSVSFVATASANPAISGWTEVLYRDTNCNGAMDGTEGSSAIAGAIAVEAGEKVCLVLKEFVPATASHGAQNQVTLTASFSYVNASPALAASYTRSDLTTVGADAGLSLLKSVDKTTALPGEVLTYTIIYTNNSGGVLSTVKVHDSTPAFTTFDRAECFGALPASISACTVSKSPAAGAVGAIEWSLTGTLGPGDSGSVRFAVKVDP